LFNVRPVGRIVFLFNVVRLVNGGDGCSTRWRFKLVDSPLLCDTLDMNTQSQQLLESALLLPESDRAEIAASLIHSLDTESDEDVDAAWAAEIQRRVESIDNGQVNLIPWDDVMREMRDRRHG